MGKNKCKSSSNLTSCAKCLSSSSSCSCNTSSSNTKCDSSCSSSSSSCSSSSSVQCCKGKCKVKYIPSYNPSNCIVPCPPYPLVNHCNGINYEVGNLTTITAGGSYVMPLAIPKKTTIYSFLTTGVGCSIELPGISYFDCGNRREVIISNVSADSITLNPYTGDSIQGQATYTLAAYSSVTLYSTNLLITGFPGYLWIVS